MTAWEDMGAEQFDRTLGTAKERRLAAKLRRMPDTLMPELDGPVLRPRARTRWADDLPPAPPTLAGQGGLFGDSEPADAPTVTQTYRDSTGAVSAVTLRAAEGVEFTLSRRTRESGPVWVLSGADSGVWSNPAAHGMARWFCPGHGGSKVCPYGAHDEIRFTGTLPDFGRE